VTFGVRIAVLFEGMLEKVLIVSHFKPKKGTHPAQRR
jgi:hypothetical protein